MSIYEYEVQTPKGQTILLERFKGKTLLIVNIASKCTFTPQLEDLEKLYRKYQNQDFIVLGFPCNQFGEQQPGDGANAVDFCKLNYGVDFPVFEKIDVNGPHAHPLFSYLNAALPFQGFTDSAADRLLEMMIREKQPEYAVGNVIKWNFTKFLIGANGQPLERFESNCYPMNFEQKIVDVLTSH